MKKTIRYYVASQPANYKELLLAWPKGVDTPLHPGVWKHLLEACFTWVETEIEVAG